MSEEMLWDAARSPPCECPEVSLPMGPEWMDEVRTRNLVYMGSRKPNGEIGTVFAVKCEGQAKGCRVWGWGT